LIPFHAGWLAAGLALIGLFTALAFLSTKFPYERTMIEQPILSLVAIELAAGAVFLIAALKACKTSFDRKLFAWMIITGGLLRFCMLPAAPVLEDDFYRYLWDGAVVAHGYNPYRYSPEEILKSVDNAPPELFKLGKEAQHITGRINHPHIKTIYPPVAQAVFAVTYPFHRLGSHYMLVWRLTLLVFDIITFILLLLILRELKLPLLYAIIYWWNPLLIKETICLGHMDVIVLPFILGAILLSIRNKFMWASVMLALAVGVKVWPVLLLPLVLRPVFRKPGRLIPALCLFTVVTAAMLIPIYLGEVDSTSGFTVYRQRWENNESLFKLVNWGVQFVMSLFSASKETWEFVSRMLAGGILIAWIIWLCRKPLENGSDLLERCLLAVAGMFLLGPTQFPWYYIWLLPLLAVKPRFSLLLLAALLPLYSLQYYFMARGMNAWFDYGIVWLEFVPVWILLAREAWLSKTEAGKRSVYLE